MHILRNLDESKFFKQQNANNQSKSKTCQPTKVTYMLAQEHDKLAITITDIRFQSFKNARSVLYLCFQEKKKKEKKIIKSNFLKGESLAVLRESKTKLKPSKS